MEFAVWIIAALLLVLIVIIYFMHSYVSDIAHGAIETRIWLEKIEEKLDKIETLAGQQLQESRNRYVR